MTGQKNARQVKRKAVEAKGRWIMTDCKHCQEVNRTVSIQTPFDLTKAIRVIRDNLTDGTLQQSNYWPHNQIKLDEPIFSDLPDHGPWPDNLHYFFKCPQCQRIFELCAETYHGAGGNWSAIEPSASFNKEDAPDKKPSGDLPNRYAAK